MKIVIQSKYCKLGVDVEDGDICAIKSEGELVPSPSDPSKKIYNFNIELVDGTQKVASFNNASLKNLIKAYGDDSKKWIGKPIIANKVKLQVFNEMKDILVWTTSDEEIDKKVDIEEEILGEEEA